MRMRNRGWLSRLQPSGRYPTLLALVSVNCLARLKLSSGKKVIFKFKLARLTCIRMVLFGELNVFPPDLLFGGGDWEVQCFEEGGVLGSG